MTTCPCPQEALVTPSLGNACAHLEGQVGHLPTVDISRDAHKNSFQEWHPDGACLAEFEPTGASAPHSFALLCAHPLG
jgi:hypothetical protein